MLKGLVASHPIALIVGIIFFLVFVLLLLVIGVFIFLKQTAVKPQQPDISQGSSVDNTPPYNVYNPNSIYTSGYQEPIYGSDSDLDSTDYDQSNVIGYDDRNQDDSNWNQSNNGTDSDSSCQNSDTSQCDPNSPNYNQ